MPLAQAKAIHTAAKQAANWREAAKFFALVIQIVSTGWHLFSSPIYVWSALRALESDCVHQIQLVCIVLKFCELCALNWKTKIFLQVVTFLLSFRR